ncbi:MAG: DUF6020 family protein [Blautia sp.]|nr:DUF6020 family protein [Lachnoclostridium sp.]MCM1211726.1 DUF6020 family protein [Blautia sp.]
MAFFSILSFCGYILKWIPLPWPFTPPHSNNIRFLPFQWYCRQFIQRPFLTSFISLFIIYLPYAIISYPAIFIADTRTQIVQAYRELNIIIPEYLEGHLLSDSVLLNTHHPIIHTLLIHFCLKIGTVLFHSANKGIFIYSILQWLCVLSVISYAIKIILEKIHIPVKYAVLILLYYIISPRIQGYMFLATKDVFYSTFLMYFLIFLYLFYSGEKNRNLYIGLLISAVGVLLFRNEAKYLLLFSFLLIAIFNKKLRKSAVYFLGFIVCFSFLYSTILSLCHVTPGSAREMLSVPFQQTARYIKYYENEVSEEEKEAINQILDYSVLAEKYNPNVSDPVKDTFNEDASTKDLLQYFKVWFQMLLKHPGTYIQATMNNYYLYFYPSGKTFSNNSYQRSTVKMLDTNIRLEPIGLKFSHPESLAPYRNYYEAVREGAVLFPPITILMIPATYTWLLILLFFYSLQNRCDSAIAFLTLPCMLVLISLLGPCNGYYCRYLYPIILCMPFIISVTFGLNQKSEIESANIKNYILT